MAYEHENGPFFRERRVQHRSARSAFLLYGLAALLPVVAFGSGSQTEAHDRNAGARVLVSRTSVNLSPFDQVADRPLFHHYAGEAEYERARADTRFAFERLTYLSDGLEVVAYLYGPRDKEVPRPTVVFNRGSYIRHDAAPEYLTTFNRLAEAGFAVLAPMYRGSEGAAGEDQMGGDDLQDLMQTARLAAELPSVDAQSLFLLGESRGGMMVLQAIRDGFPAKAAAVYGSPTDFFALFADHPAQYEGIADQLWPEWRTNRDEILGRRSAVRWADALNMPILIMHGGNDQSMPVSQSLVLAARLDALDKVYELHVFGYENHAISGRAIERDALAAAWYRQHLSGQAAE